MRNMVESGRVDMRVLSSVPWFPIRSKIFGKYGAYARIPPKQIRYGIEVEYPRYFVIPKIGSSLAALSMALSLAPSIRRLIRAGFEFDLIDAYYFFPDGVAAAILGKIFEKPVVITAYGNDISLIPNDPLARRQIQWAASRAAGITTVCQALKEALISLGAPESRIRVVLHGVDLSLFRPSDDRAETRRDLGLVRPTLLSVGHLIERKGHDLVISAMRALPDMELLVAGDGEEEINLRRLAQEIHVADRVHFLGHVSQDQLVNYYNAADALVLASSREGIANVIMEALACGTPVVATAVWGAPEVITSPVAGVLIKERSEAALADGVKCLLGNLPARSATRKFVEPYTWEATTRGHLALLDDIFDEKRAAAAKSGAITISNNRCND